MDKLFHSHPWTPLLIFPNASKDLCSLYASVKKPPILFSKASRPSFSLSYSTHDDSRREALSDALQTESLEILEWSSVCKQLSAFASTSMGLELAQKASIPFGRTREESEKLLHQTKAAESAMKFVSPRLEFSGIENISGIVNSAASGELLTVAELCAVKRTLRAARELFEKLEAAASGDSSQRYLSLLEIFGNCNFHVELERKIDFCIDCNFLTIYDRASEELELIRSERKKNMDKLDALLKATSSRVFQAGGIDKPLITKRRGRMCVGVRASHKHLVSDGVVLNSSSSGVTYFVEPKEAIELNNMEVWLLNSEKTEEIAILSLLTTEIAESKMGIEYLLDRILEFDLAFSRAAHAQWINGVCPSFTDERYEGESFDGTDFDLSIDIDGIQNPLLLESSLRSSSKITSSSSVNVLQSDNKKSSMTVSNYPVPIDIKIKCQTRVVVISGPNTGGKTASLKTLGLVSLMAKAGLYLPARNRPRLPWFDLVLVDIGDHQSLEQNLSTFSGHISRICKISEVSSKKSLVLIDEIGSGTDPSEGVALSASILKYLKDRVNLAVVTTHYADLTCLKEEDCLFENAAVEFSIETLRPTYRIIWGSIGESNALIIAKFIGFNPKLVERAQTWMEKLRPEEQTERKGLLYQSLVEEKNRLETHRKRADSLHAEILDLYNEIQNEARDLDRREIALKEYETRQVQQIINAAKSKMEAVILDFESQLKISSINQINALVRKSESAIASIVEEESVDDGFLEANSSPYAPQFGEQVRVIGLGNKLATVVEAPEDDETVLVQYGKIKFRVKKSNIRPLPSNEINASANSVSLFKRQVQRSREFLGSSDASKGAASYGPVVQTSKNTVDLRGMRVEEASLHLDMAISSSRSNSVIFIIHGMGTGTIKERALEILRKHPRVAKYEQDDPMNYGCTVAYIKFEMRRNFQKNDGEDDNGAEKGERLL